MLQDNYDINMTVENEANTTRECYLEKPDIYTAVSSANINQTSWLSYVRNLCAKI